MKTHVYVLAGGFATRLWPLCSKRAKPLLLLNGKPILELIFDQLDPQWEVTILTNTRFAQDIESCLQKTNHTNWNIFLEDAYSDAQKLGALRALALASQTKEPHNMLVIAGDNYLPSFDPKKLITTQEKAKLLGYDIEEKHKARKFGVLITDETNNVTDFEEKPSHPKSTIVSTGFFFLGAQCFEELQNFSKENPDNLGGIFEHLIKNTNIHVSAHITKGDWFDIGSFDQYIAAHKKIQKEILMQAKNSHIDATRTNGKVFIGENCIIKNCILTDCIIYPNTSLSNCHISRSIIDKNCTLKNLDLNNKIIRANTHF